MNKQMKRFFFFVLCCVVSLAVTAQNTRSARGVVFDEKGTPMEGVKLTAVGTANSVVTGVDGTFDIAVATYTKYVEVSKEGYHSMQLEIDGSYLIARLQVDKKYAENKAKAEEQARIAAEKEAEAKAKAEEQARIAAQKEAEAKAKAEEQARIAAEAKAKAEEDMASIMSQKYAEAKAKAEQQALQALLEQARQEAEAEMRAAEQARIAAQEKAEAEMKAAEQARIAAQKKAEAEMRAAKRAAKKQLIKAENEKEVEQFHSKHGWYGQYVSLGYGFDMNSMAAHSIGFNYIGGCSIHRNFFLGVGTGVNVNAITVPYVENVIEIGLTNSDKVFTQLSQVTNTKLYESLVSIPVFLHLRSDFAHRGKWNPYASLSLGTNISTKPFQGELKGVAYKDSGHMYMGDLTIGANYQVSDKLAIYFGVSGGVAFKSSSFYCVKQAIFDGVVSNPTVSTWSSGYAYHNLIGLSRINLKATVGFAF